MLSYMQNLFRIIPPVTFPRKYLIIKHIADNIPYDQKLQQTDLEYLFSSENAMGSLAENYVGLPF